MKIAALSVLVIPAVFAQPSLDCSRVRYCEIREQTTSATGRFSVDDVRNGSITVRGSNRSDVMVRMRVEAEAHSDREAKDILTRIHTHVSPGRFSVDGPMLPNNPIDWFFGTGWHVSVEVLVPSKTDVTLTTHNGGIWVEGIDGRAQVRTHNGGIKLTNVAGDTRFESHNGGIYISGAGASVEGSTHNGGVEIELKGQGTGTRSVRVDSHNGGITVGAPASYTAHVTADTHNGGFRSDFPTRTERGGHREFEIGSGGGTIRLTTHNGGIRLRKI